MAENIGTVAAATPAPPAAPNPNPTPASSPAPGPGPMVIGRALHFRPANGKCEPALVFDSDSEEGPGIVSYNPSEGWRPRWNVKQNATEPGAAHWPSDCPEKR